MLQAGQALASGGGEARADKIFVSLCTKGNERACSAHGAILLRRGDAKHARDVFEKRRSADVGSACRMLGVMVAKGVGGKRDEARASRVACVRSRLIAPLDPVGAFRRLGGAR